LLRHVSQCLEGKISPDPRSRNRRVDDKTEVTYLNLQRFLKVHFVKPVAA
jgi:hypothetical protein